MKKPNTSRAKSSAKARTALYIEAMIVNGGNKRAAALAAGAVSDKAADKYAARVSRNVSVQQELTRRQAEISAKLKMDTGISVERTLREVARLAYLDPSLFYDKEGNLLEIHEMPEEARACIGSIEIEERFEGSGKDRVHAGFLKKLKPWDKNAALEKLMKHLGQFERDNVQKPPMLPPIINVIGVKAK